MEFVSDIQKLYYSELLTYNMHSLVHLSEDVKIHGKLDNFSAFPFENYMQKLKRLVRKKNDHLIQLVNRLHEIDSHSSLNSNVGKPSIRDCYGSKFCIIKGIRYSVNSGDDCFLTKCENVVIIQRIDTSSRDGVKFICQYFKDKNKLSHYACNSKLLSIFVVGRLSKRTKVFQVNDFEKKCVLTSKSEEGFYVSIPFCNSSSEYCSYQP